MAIFNGTSGNDTFQATTGADTFNGLGGQDTVTYVNIGNGLTINLISGNSSSGAAFGDTFNAIEIVYGTHYDDGIFGNDEANTLYGQMGRDTLYGAGGANFLYGGDDTDNLVGGSGIDFIDGGNGIDTLSYQLAVSAVIASLADPAINTGDAAGDVYVSIENISGSAFNDILYGDKNNNNMLGWPGHDTLYGGAGNDAIQGQEGDDLIYGGDDWDLLVGGAGRDAAGFTGPISNYTLRRSGSDYTCGTTVGNEGTDTLQSIEALRFGDMSVNLTLKTTATTVSPTNLKLLQELYVAFFNRIPDADGLEYWIGRYNAGMTVNQIAEAFYAAGVGASSVTGFSTSMSNADFVNIIYKNVLGRSDGADAEGLAYWSGALDRHEQSRGSLVSSILNVAHAYKNDATWHWVADLLDNKAAVANTFAVTLGLNYLSDSASITGGMKIAAAVTATDTSAALALMGVTAEQIAI